MINGTQLTKDMLLGTEQTTGSVIAFVITGIVFLVIGLYLVWKYFDLRSSNESYKLAGENYAKGSWKGFWHRNRSGIIAFLAFFMVFIAIYLFAIGILGITVDAKLS